MQKYTFFIASGLSLALFALPFAASAASLTSAQANAIVGLLQAFGANQSVVLSVEQDLGLAPAAEAPASVPPPVLPPHVPVVGSVYKSSNLGFDYSYNAPLFPPDSFGFGIVGTSGGKSFTQNSRLAQEIMWAKFGSGAAPTLYMNLNAPYGSTVAGHVSAPENCPVTTVGTTTEPTDCAGYNYGYQAAQSAFTYGKSVNAPLWWLDIETANSWSTDVSVNDATIQGAIDYLNAQGVRVGVYSMPNMWDEIAGPIFVPTQKINGQAVSIPNWVPIGTDTQVGATNACLTTPGFITGSPVWLIQYEANSTATDQNVAC